MAMKLLEPALTIVNKMFTYEEFCKRLHFDYSIMAEWNVAVLNTVNLR